jgi:hypothetical protein
VGRSGCFPLSQVADRGASRVAEIEPPIVLDRAVLAHGELDYLTAGMLNEDNRVTIACDLPMLGSPREFSVKVHRLRHDRLIRRSLQYRQAARVGAQSPRVCSFCAGRKLPWDCCNSGWLAKLNSCSHGCHRVLCGFMANPDRWRNLFHIQHSGTSQTNCRGAMSGTVFTIEVDKRQYLSTAKHVVSALRDEDEIALFKRRELQSAAS